MQIAFIGGGTMGTAGIGGLLRQGIAAPEEISVYDPVAARRDLLSKEYGVTVAQNDLQALEGADIVVLAVKPQDLAEVMAELRSHLTGRQTVLSIVTGANLMTLISGLGCDKIVRAMPNTAAQISESITVWTSTDDVTAPEKENVVAVLRAWGRDLYVSDEKYLDMATALSGSGPAYVLLVIESLIDAGVYIGLPRNMAAQMVVETILGTSRLVQQVDKHPAELRNMVTSPGGTTVEGLQQLEAGGLRAILVRAVVAAYDKAKRLAEASGK